MYVFDWEIGFKHTSEDMDSVRIDPVEKFVWSEFELNPHWEQRIRCPKCPDRKQESPNWRDSSPIVEASALHIANAHRNTCTFHNSSTKHTHNPNISQGLREDSSKTSARSRMEIRTGPWPQSCAHEADDGIPLDKFLMRTADQHIHGIDASAQISAESMGISEGIAVKHTLPGTEI